MPSVSKDSVATSAASDELFRGRLTEEAEQPWRVGAAAMFYDNVSRVWVPVVVLEVDPNGDVTVDNDMHRQVADQVGRFGTFIVLISVIHIIFFSTYQLCTLFLGGIVVNFVVIFQ